MYTQLKEEMEKAGIEKAAVDGRRKEAEGQLKDKEARIRALEYENNHLRKRVEEVEGNEKGWVERVQRAEGELIAREEQLRHIRGDL